jgi:hypothetical protein
VTKARLDRALSLLPKGLCLKNLQEATERICELKGSLIALDAVVTALIEALPATARAKMPAAFEAHAEAARTVLQHADISDMVLSAFERDVARHRQVPEAGPVPAAPAAGPRSAG